MKRMIRPGDLVTSRGAIVLSTSSLSRSVIHDDFSNGPIIQAHNICLVLAVIDITAPLYDIGDDNHTWRRCLLLASDNNTVRIGWTWMNLVITVEHL